MHTLSTCEFYGALAAQLMWFERSVSKCIDIDSMAASHQFLMPGEDEVVALALCPLTKHVQVSCVRILLDAQAAVCFELDLRTDGTYFFAALLAQHSSRLFFVSLGL